MRSFVVRLCKNLCGQRRASGVKHSGNTRRRSRRGPSMDFSPLEPRQLLASVSLNPNNQVLTFVGFATDDVASVSVLNSTQLRASLQGLGSFDFNSADVKTILFLGNKGNDQFSNGTSIPASIYGHSGNDTLSGGSNHDVIIGGPGDDIIAGNAGDDLIRGVSGNDEIRGGWGNDRIFGSYTGTNTIYAGEGNDVVYGGLLADTIYGEGGLDQIFGLAGNDFLYSGAGGVAGTREITNADLVMGNDGDDVLTGGSGLDVMYAGNGNDKFVGGSGENRMFGNAGNDEMMGGDSADFMVGGDGNDIMFGMGGHDTLYGGNGDDSLYGGNNIDSLYGEAGNDGLFSGVNPGELKVGGTGADRFLGFGSDTASDIRAEDALIRFTNRTSAWSNVEIESIDRGLRAVHHRTGSTLFFKDTVDPNVINVEKFGKGQLGSGIRASNGLLWQGSWTQSGAITSETYTRQIKFADWDESNELDNEWAALSIIHELAHSWDSSFEIAKKLPNQASLWNRFVQASGWSANNPGAGYIQAVGQSQEPFDRVFNTRTLNYDVQTRSWWYWNAAVFARNYGKITPQEDWGTVWESVFMAELVANPTAAYAQPVAAKVNIVNQLLDAM